MGAEPYWYYVKYQSDINAALNELRQHEFKAGRYNPVITFPSELFPIGPDSPSPGAQHNSIEEALADAEESGTRSILDLNKVADTSDYFTVIPIEDDVLQNLYGTTKPTRKMIEQNMDYFENVQRGQGIYIVLYKDGVPDEIFFAGYSFD